MLSDPDLIQGVRTNAAMGGRVEPLHAAVIVGIYLNKVLSFFTL